MSSEFWVITSYFNPARFETKRRNFERFMAGMKAAGANVLVVEMAFGDAPFELEPAKDVVRFRGDGIMWQKERLLNVASTRLPDSCRKVGWFDADIVFKEPDWLERTCEALDRHVVVQPFSHAVRLHRDNQDDGTGVLDESFASVFVRSPRPARTMGYHHHGHTGYAWAARRELFDSCGLYDACLTGSADHMMAHAFAAGMAKSPCMGRTFGGAPEYADHFFEWAFRARDLVHAKLGVVPGRILHLWHGDLADRRYADIERHFRTLRFDPARHLRHDPGGMLDWSDEAPEELKNWSYGLFHNRNEDGKAAPADDRKPAPKRAAAAR